MFPQAVQLKKRGTQEVLMEGKISLPDSEDIKMNGHPLMDILPHTRRKRILTVLHREMVQDGISRLREDYVKQNKGTPRALLDAFRSLPREAQERAIGEYLGGGEVEPETATLRRTEELLTEGEE